MYRLAFKQADLKEVVALLNAYDVAVEKSDIELVCKCDEDTYEKVVKEFKFEGITVEEVER